MRNLIIALIFVASLLAQEEPQLFPECSLASSEGIINGIVGGHVCAISGSFVDTSVDFILPGPDPFVFSRSFVNPPYGVDRFDFHASWRWSHVSWIERLKDSLARKAYISYHMPSAGNLHFTHNYESNCDDIECHLTNLGGLTNASVEKISAHNNLKNLRLKLMDSKNAYIVDGSGTKTHFYKADGHASANLFYYPSKTEKPDGTFLFYDIKDRRPRKFIQANKDAQPQNTLTFRYDEKCELHTVVEIVASNGLSARYESSMAPLKGNKHGSRKRYLSKVSYSHKPEIEYAYLTTENKYKKVLSRKSWGDKKHYLRIDYEPFKEYSAVRVKSLNAPWGELEREIPIWSFEYNLDEKFTAAFDALHRRTHYVYNDDYRLKEICKFKSGDLPYVKELFTWGQKDSQDEANLISHSLTDPNGNVLLKKKFAYDPKGNVIQETWIGQFSEAKITSQYHKRQKFSNNKFSNLLSYEEDNGKKIIYHYYPNTCLLKAKFFLENDRVIKREFHEVDLNTTMLVKKSVDDGSSLDEANDENVTERHITRYLQPQKIPFCLPGVVEDVVVDFLTGEEKLLSRHEKTYLKTGQVTREKVFDAKGEYRYTLEWDYDSHGNVVREKDAMGYEIFKKYDANDRLIWEKGPRHDVHFEYSYDLADRLVATREVHNDGTVLVTTQAYDLVGNEIASVDIYGNRTSYEYDDMNRLVATVQPDGARTQTVYNLLNQPIETVDALGNTTYAEYNIRGQPIKITHPDGSVETFLYNLDGSLLKTVGKTGLITQYTWDLQERLLTKRECDASGTLLTSLENKYNAFHLVSSTDAEGNITEYRYDPFGNLTSLQSPQRCQQIEYDALGRQAKIIEGEKVIFKEYDLLNRIIEERVESKNGEVFKRIRKAYDFEGNCTHLWAGDDALTYTEYNSQGWPTLIVDAFNNATHIHYSFDETRIKTTVDPNGQVTVETHDVCGRLREVEKKNSFGAQIYKQSFSYDLKGNKTAVIDTVLANGDLLRQTAHRFEYDSMNQLTRFVEASGDPEQRVTTHSYLQGQKRSTVKPDGVSLHYEYNILGLLQNFWGSDHSFHYRYTYNRNLLPTLIEDMKNGTANCLSYDSENQLIEEVLGNELTLKYGYDALGRIQRVGLPDATDIEYFYSPCALKEVRRGSIKHIYENYNLLGQVTEVLLTNGQRATYAYDLKGRPKEIAAPHFQESDFNYDAVGNLTSYRQVDSLGTVSNAYAYDELYQLVSERNHTYSHDSLFNRLSKDGTSYGVNVLNQITSQGNFEYSYDACGNLIERSSPTETVRFAYDALDRLTSVKTPMETITYTYDSFNRRLFANEKRFVYQGQNEIGAFENGVFTELRLLDPSKEAEIGAAVAVILKDIVYTPIHDHNGNVACLIDPTNIPLTYRYSAYGEEETSLLASNPWRFASKRLDPETGFIFFGHRYYDPALGRFITTDPTGYDDGPNLYAYVRNNPLLSTDLYGLNFHHTGPDHNRPSFDPFERSRYSTSNESFNDRFSDIRSEYNDTHGSCAENFRDFASSLNLTGSWQDIAAARYWNDRQNSNDRQDEDRGFFDRIFDNLLDMGCAYINRHLDYACGCLDGFLNPIDSLRDIKDRFSSQPLSLRNIDYGTGVGIGILASIIPLGRTANVAVQTAKSSKLFRIFGRALGLEGFSLKNTYSVYQGVDAKGIVQYVGITFRKPIVRFTEHLRSVGTGKELLKYGSLRDAKNLTFTQARVWEQKLINQYGLKKNGGTLLNQRHSIAEKHWWKHRIN